MVRISVAKVEHVVKMTLVAVVTGSAIAGSTWNVSDGSSWCVMKTKYTSTFFSSLRFWMSAICPSIRFLAAVSVYVRNLCSELPLTSPCQYNPTGHLLPLWPLSCLALEAQDQPICRCRHLRQDCWTPRSISMLFTFWYGSEATFCTPLFSCSCASNFCRASTVDCNSRTN